MNILTFTNHQIFLHEKKKNRNFFITLGHVSIDRSTHRSRIYTTVRQDRAKQTFTSISAVWQRPKTKHRNHTTQGPSASTWEWVINAPERSASTLFTPSKTGYYTDREKPFKRIENRIRDHNTDPRDVGGSRRTRRGSPSHPSSSCRCARARSPTPSYVTTTTTTTPTGLHDYHRPL